MGKSDIKVQCLNYNQPVFSTILDEINQVKFGRDRRVALIKGIQNLTGRKLITYISAFNHPLSNINKDDIIPFEDILRSAGDAEKIDLLIHSPGGEPDTAEKIVKLCRSYCKEFRVIVPNSAKSAATLISLGADEIVMGHVSELGPIDPQITYKLSNGQWVRHPAQSIIDSFEKIKKEIGDGPIPKAYIPILNNIDPALLDYCEKATMRSKELALKLLKSYSLKDNADVAETIAATLSDANTHLSHGRVIDAKEAIDMGLKIRKIDKNDDLWMLIWELYCRSDFFVNNSQKIKLFENEQNIIIENK